jgi:hypothetical protein
VSISSQEASSTSSKSRASEKKQSTTISHKSKALDVCSISRTIATRQTQENEYTAAKSISLAASARRDVPERIRTRSDVASWIIWCQAQFLAGLLERGDYFLALGGFAIMDRFLPRDGTVLDVPLQIPQYLNEVINGKVVRSYPVALKRKENVDGTN